MPLSRLSVNGQTVQGKRRVSLANDDDSENREYLSRISREVVEVEVIKSTSVVFNRSRMNIPILNKNHEYYNLIKNKTMIVHVFPMFRPFEL